MLYECPIIENTRLQGDYYRIDFMAPEIAGKTEPGQFIHLKINELRDRVLRRPFSICDVNEKNGQLTVIYKVVGTGTQALSLLKPQTMCGILGPLGKGFTCPVGDELPVIVAGGYGAAATYLLAERSPRSGVLLLGARTKNDLLLTDRFPAIGFEVITATDDGSEGYHGFVTELIPKIIGRFKNEKLRFYGCGPQAMLMRMGTIVIDEGYDAELSLDNLMCCGVGACFACVIKVKDDNIDGWRYARTCSEGPVFNAVDVVI